MRINRPRLISNSNMAPRLSGQTVIFGVVFFVSKSLLGIDTEYNFDLKASEFYKNINICNVAYCFKLKRL